MVLPRLASGQHHGEGNLAEPMGQHFVKMTRGTGGANMKNIFADQREKKITRPRRQQELPPMQCSQTFRRHATGSHTQQSSCAKTDEGT